MTTADVLVTLRADALQLGDVVRLLSEEGETVNDIRVLPNSRCIVHLLGDSNHPYGSSVWLWKHSRIEVLSDVSGRGALATPQHAVSGE